MTGGVVVTGDSGAEAGFGAPARPDEVWQTARGRLVVSHPGNAVMLFTYDGYATADFVPFIEGAVDRVLATGMRPDVFIDLDRIEGYDSEYRQAVSKWGARTYRRLGEVRFLVRSRIVAMGIAVSNLTAGGQLKPTTKRAEFQAALQSAVARQAARA